ncbi:helix-turn-helix domain-containing protein [Runella limosa]|uniref:helix-turn-helix domain-containing protein n=1 Tax=Runella limosa TaxID=370978 RepID=UPI000428148E|nr:helix-turn-helix transcriptional regulator [Runella limosa]
MNFGEKVKYLREYLNLKRPAFAKMIDVSLDTVQRVEHQNPEHKNEYLLSEIVRVFPDVESFFAGQSAELPDNLLRSVALNRPLSPSLADGERLRVFLSRKGIMQKELAEKLGLSAAQVNHYLKTENLRSDIKRKIADALNFPEILIFPQSIVNSSSSSTDIIALPIFSAIDRSSLTYQTLIDTLENFSSGFSKPYLMDKEAIGTNELKKAFIIEATHLDSMQPILPASALALAVLLHPDQYDTLTNDFVLISFNIKNIMIRKIAANNLRTANSLQLSTLDGGTITVRRSDINFICVLKKAIIDL